MKQQTDEVPYRWWGKMSFISQDVYGRWSVDRHPVDRYIWLTQLRGRSGMQKLSLNSLQFLGVRGLGCVGASAEQFQLNIKNKVDNVTSIQINCWIIIYDFLSHFMWIWIWIIKKMKNEIWKILRHIPKETQHLGI